jgi:hypothetical protein
VVGEGKHIVYAEGNTRVKVEASKADRDTELLAIGVMVGETVGVDEQSLDKRRVRETCHG